MASTSTAGRSRDYRQPDPTGARLGHRHALEQAGREHLAELQVVEVDVADVAVAVDVRTRARHEARFPAGLVEVTDRLGDEVAAAHRAVAVDRDRALAGAAGLAQARPALRV